MLCRWRMHGGCWDLLVSVSLSGPAGLPPAIYSSAEALVRGPLICSPRTAAGYTFVPPAHTHIISFKALCEEECRLIPVLFCNAQEHLITCLQKWTALAQEGSSWASIVGEVAAAMLTANRVTALSQCEQPQWPFPSASRLSAVPLNIHEYSS